MKKILFFLPSLSIGGLERVLVTLANALSERGHEVTVMTYEKGEELASELGERIKFCYKKPKPFSIMRKIPYIRHRFYDDGMWETRASAKRLHKYYIGKEKFDVEIAFFRGMSIKVISGSNNRDAIKLAWVHNDFLHCGGYQNNFRSLANVKKAYSTFNRIVCVSQQAKKSFDNVIGYSNKTTCIYNLLDIARIRKLAQTSAIDHKVFTVVAVGRLVEAKGFDRLIEAVNTLNQESLEFELWLVGDGADRHKLERFVAEKEMKNIRFFGMQTNPYQYIAKADMLVCSSRYEGYNLTVAEAMILGKPVLSTDCTGPNEILDGGKYGMIVENSTHGLTDGLRKMITDRTVFENYIKMTAERQPFFESTHLINEIEGLMD